MFLQHLSLLVALPLAVLGDADGGHRAFVHHGGASAVVGPSLHAATVDHAAPAVTHAVAVGHSAPRCTTRYEQKCDTTYDQVHFTIFFMASFNIVIIKLSGLRSSPAALH